MLVYHFLCPTLSALVTYVTCVMRDSLEVVCLKDELPQLRHSRVSPRGLGIHPSYQSSANPLLSSKCIKHCRLRWKYSRNTFSTKRSCAEISVHLMWLRHLKHKHWNPATWTSRRNQAPLACTKCSRVFTSDTFNLLTTMMLLLSACACSQKWVNLQLADMSIAFRSSGSTNYLQFQNNEWINQLYCVIHCAPLTRDCTVPVIA